MHTTTTTPVHTCVTARRTATIHKHSFVSCYISVVDMVLCLPVGASTCCSGSCCCQKGMADSLRFCVIKQLQNDSFLVNVSAPTTQSNGSSKAEKCLLRIISLQTDSMNLETPLRAADDILRQFDYLRCLMKDSDCMCIPYAQYVSVPPVPEAVRGRQMQVHAFLPATSISGLRSASLQCAALPRSEEVLWRLLSLLCSALSMIQVDSPDLPFFTFFGCIDESNVYVDWDDAAPSAVHRIHLELTLPNSLYLDYARAHADTARRYWSAKDLRAVGRLVTSTATRLGIDPSPELQFILRRIQKEDRLTDHPTAAQIVNFQAVSLRMRCWELECALEQLQRDRKRGEQQQAQNEVGVVSSPSIADRSTASADASLSIHNAQLSLARREADVRKREAKIDVFLELYQMTVEQLDSVPDSLKGAAEFLHHRAVKQPRPTHTLSSERSTEAVQQYASVGGVYSGDQSSPSKVGRGESLQGSPALTPVAHAVEPEPAWAPPQMELARGAEQPRQQHDFDDSSIEVIRIAPDTPKQQQQKQQQHSAPKMMAQAPNVTVVQPQSSSTSPSAAATALHDVPRVKSNQQQLSTPPRKREQQQQQQLLQGTPLSSVLKHSAQGDESSRSWMDCHLAELAGMQQQLHVRAQLSDAQLTPPRELHGNFALQWQASARRERAARRFAKRNSIESVGKPE